MEKRGLVIQHRESEPKDNKEGVHMGEGDHPGKVPERSRVRCRWEGVLLQENGSRQGDQPDILRLMGANFLTDGEVSYKYRKVENQKGPCGLT